MSGVCDIPVLSTVCQTAGQAAGTLVEAPFDWLAQAAGNSAGWMFQSVWSVFNSTTLVDVTSDNYLKVYNVLFGIAIFIMLIFFFLQLITGLLRRDATALHRAALGLAKSVLGSFLVITLTATLLQIVDQLCVGIIEATGTTLHEMGAKIGALVIGLTTINIASAGVGAIITIFLSFLAIAAAAIVWFSLLVRKALLLVGIVLAPIALSGTVWDATKGWVGKWAAFVIALIVSKLVIVVVFLVAINQLNAPINFDLTSISDRSPASCSCSLRGSPLIWPTSSFPSSASTCTTPCPPSKKPSKPSTGPFRSPGNPPAMRRRKCSTVWAQRAAAALRHPRHRPAPLRPVPAPGELVALGLPRQVRRRRH